jgi:hypothetical protein
MDYLKLNSTKLILQMVASNNGAYTWYNIVKAIDQMNNVQQVPPTYEVLKELTRLAYLQIDPFEEGNFGKYWITEAGFALLNTGVYKVSKICGVSPRVSACMPISSIICCNGTLDGVDMTSAHLQE